MAQNVCITGTGREMALGFHFVLRYLEHGDHVIATVRKPSEALERLKRSTRARSTFSQWTSQAPRPSRPPRGGGAPCTLHRPAHQ